MKRSSSGCQPARSTKRARPRSVWREMNGTPRDQPMPTGPLPPLVAYESASDGLTPARPGGSAIGTVNVPVPDDSTGANDSPIPAIEPSALGSEIACGVTALLPGPDGSETGTAPDESGPSGTSMARGALTSVRRAGSRSPATEGATDITDSGGSSCPTAGAATAREP